MTKLCNTCEYLKFCARSGIEDVGCDRYKRDTTTNEEWFCGLSTEEKAEKLTDFSFWLVPTIPTVDKREQVRKRIENWLKEKHE